MAPSRAELARPRPSLVRIASLAVPMLLLLVLGVAALAAFAWPRGAVADSIEFRVGELDDFPPGTVSSQLVPGEAVRAHRDPALRDGFLLHISRLDDGRIVALLGEEPVGDSFWCTLPWKEQFMFHGVTGWFRVPCRASTFDREGYLVEGFATRHLDAFPVEVREDGSVIVDVGHRIERPLYAPRLPE